MVPVFPPPNTVEPPSGLHPSLLTITAAGATSSIPPPPSATFGSPLALSALNETIALHLARLGSFGALDTFLAESGTPSPSEGLLADLRLLHSILAELQNGSCTSALDWVTSNASLGVDPKGDLEFALRKDEFVRLLLSSSDLSSSTDPLLPTPSTSYASPSTQAALAYGGHHFRPFHTPAREATIQALFTAPLYMPFSRLLASPYAALFEEYDEGEGGKGGGTTGLMGMFTGAFLRRVGLQRDSPLSVVTDIGGGGAMARIQKVRAVMKEKRTEWSAVDELPVRPLSLARVVGMELMRWERRSRSPSRRVIATTRYLRAPSPRSNRPRRTLRCSFLADTLSPRRVWCDWLEERRTSPFLLLSGRTRNASSSRFEAGASSALIALRWTGWTRR